MYLFYLHKYLWNVTKIWTWNSHNTTCVPFLRIKSCGTWPWKEIALPLLNTYNKRKWLNLKFAGMDSVRVCGQKVASLTDGGRVAVVWWHEGAGGIERGRGGNSPPPQDFGRFRSKTFSIKWPSNISYPPPPPGPGFSDPLPSLHEVASQDPACELWTDYDDDNVQKFPTWHHSSLN